MVATQVARRRGTSAQCESMTPVEGEIIVDLTRDALRVGDGSRVGGWIMPNFSDLQNQSMQFGVASGTGNALVLNLDPAPISYTQGFRVSFRASANNTGPVTININGLGAANIKKVVESITTDLVTGDLVTGVLYEIVYNGSEFQLLTSYQRGLVSVGQGDLRTSSGFVEIVRTSASGGNSANFVLPGGSYGFYPRIRRGTTAWTSTTAEAQIFTGAAVTATARSQIYLSINNGVPGHLLQAYQEYVTASPPYDLGNGDVGGFIFLMLDSLNNVLASYVSDTPPWAYNGPTDIRATHKCPVTGMKYRTVRKKMSVRDIIEGAPIEYVQQEITHAIKNADMDVIPHPFIDVPAGCKIIMLDPMDSKTERLISVLNSGGHEEVSEIINGGYLKLDNTNIKRGCHNSVKACKFGYKNNG